jgi:outer membrane protein OmpA-like peptidoglycan-associated protein
VEPALVRVIEASERVMLLGFADSRRSAAMNLKLSEDRAPAASGSS